MDSTGGDNLLIYFKLILTLINLHFEGRRVSLRENQLSHWFERTRKMHSSLLPSFNSLGYAQQQRQKQAALRARGREEQRNYGDTSAT